ncbi:alpha/beta fold hydrolase [Allomuricauda sp. NBRC 101325]|uniref:alpha/beta fold hydrolase n=1 Tax=Allomuricauda sp. NBRC 101325 TaxID=1113758 RepID=UPI0024A0195C|nr:alpha/beta hydrolase [Muricauda sp. NBRC 101325]GLU45259.1 hypothetical protein Musp01_28830 [Muricauda sp. NBRC 101325]
MKQLKKILFNLVLVIGIFSCKAPKNTSLGQNESLGVDQVKSLQIRGEEFHYIENGKGAPLIFIHGTTGDYRAWISHMETYSNDYHVIAYSRRYAFPNKQVFDKSLDYSVRIHADDLFSLITKLNLKKVNIVAHSYGASTALLMAMEHPEIVNSMVLGEPPLISLAQNTAKGREGYADLLDNHLRPAKNEFEAGNNEAALEHFIQWILGDDFQMSQVPQEDKQGGLDNLPELWGMAMNEVLTPTLDEVAIKTLEVPVLLLVGDISPVLLIEGTNELHRLLPNSEIVRFENMNHGLFFEQPEAVDKTVMDFLNRN